MAELKLGQNIHKKTVPLGESDEDICIDVWFQSSHICSICISFTGLTLR